MSAAHRQGERRIGEAELARLARALDREGRASGTVECYLRSARAFARWLKGAPASEGSAAAWREELLASGYAPASVNAMLAGVNKLFAVLGWETCRARSLRIQRRAFRDESRELSRNEYRRLVSAARSGRRTRTALAMETICATGIRVSELEYITVEAAGAGRAEVALKGKVRTVLIPRRPARKLLGYARHRGISEGPVLLGRDGRPLSRQAVWAEMKGLARAARVAATKVFPHNLRHLFARSFYEACHDVVRLADVLGHSSVETTRIYLVTTGAEQARIIERLGLIE